MTHKNYKTDSAPIPFEERDKAEAVAQFWGGLLRRSVLFGGVDDEVKDFEKEMRDGLSKVLIWKPDILEGRPGDSIFSVDSGGRLSPTLRSIADIALIPTPAFPDSSTVYEQDGVVYGHSGFDTEKGEALNLRQIWPPVVAE